VVAQEKFGASGVKELNSVAVEELSIDDEFGARYTVAYATKTRLALPTQGTLSARLKLKMPANAVVEALELVVTARRADEALASEVAELRGTALGGNKHEIVVDFGTVRTIAAVRFATGCFIHRVDAWDGTRFPMLGFDAPFVNLDLIPAGSIPNRTFARFTSERRTERLKITVTSQSKIDVLLDALSVILPDSPKDLTVTLNGGAPVASLPGPAAKGGSAMLTADAWNSDSRRLIVLTDVFRGLTGNPLDETEREHELVLTSREAGVLEIAEHRRAIRRIRRARFGSETTTTVAAESEGITALPLSTSATPAGAVAQEVSLIVSGKFGSERRLPPVGPDPTPGLDDPAAPLVSLDMTAERAVLFRVASVAGLPALSGLRLRLVPGAEGAEVRLAPWSNAGPGRVQPSGVMDKLMGDPVVLEPGGPEWQSLLFGGPLEIDEANAPWIAVLVTRGAASVGLSAQGQGEARVGPPSGPWRALPALFATSAYSALRFPYRAIGDAADAADPTPISIAVAGTPAARTIDPVPRGARFTLKDFTTTAPSLAITQLAGGEIELADIDIVFDR
jgi:hypothetical protein